MTDPTDPTGAVGGNGQPGEAPETPGPERPERPAPAEKREDTLANGDLDEALDETFPASDPLPPPSTPGTD